MNIEAETPIHVLALGDILEINAPAKKHYRLMVTGIHQYTVEPFGPMVDYVFKCDPGGPQVRLRLLPSETDKARFLVLTLYDNRPYSVGLHEVVRDESAKLIIHEDTDKANIAGDIFWRIYDVRDSHVSSVNIRSSDTGIVKAEIEYWDYSRLTDIEGVETEEFIFVEMNKADGWFQVWRGVEVALGRITVT